MVGIGLRKVLLALVRRTGMDGLIVGGDGQCRCWWPGDKADYMAYHDDEWGVPVADDHKLFEKLCLEGMVGPADKQAQCPSFNSVSHTVVPLRLEALHSGLQDGRNATSRRSVRDCLNEDP